MSRTRRPSEDVRALLISAARKMFRADGYDATTTKAIADAAGVSEPLLFSNFGSKAGLFEAAVLAPIADFVADYAATFSEETAQREPEVRVDAFVRGLFTLAQDNRAVLLAALMRGDREPDDILDRVARSLQGLAGVSDLHHFDDVDGPAAVTAAVGMVLGVALLDELLHPMGSRRPGRSRLIDEMEKLLIFGTTARTGSPRRGRQ